MNNTAIEAWLKPIMDACREHDINPTSLLFTHAAEPTNPDSPFTPTGHLFGAVRAECFNWIYYGRTLIGLLGWEHRYPNQPCWPN